MKIRSSHLVFGTVFLIFALIILILVVGRKTTSNDFLEEVRQLREQGVNGEITGMVPSIEQSQSLIAKIELDSKEIDLGTIPPDKPHQAFVTIRNTGLIPLQMGSMKSSCACLAAEMKSGDEKIPPGGEGVLVLTVFPKRIIGFSAEKTVTIFTNDTHNNPLELSITVDIDPELELIPDEVDFGDFNQGETPISRIRIRQLQDEPFKINDVTIIPNKNQKGDIVPEMPLALSYEAVPESDWKTPGKVEFDVLLAPPPEFPVGYFLRYINIQTDIERLKNLPVKVVGTVKPAESPTATAQ